MSLTALERETVITYNDAEDTARVLTHRRRDITRLKKIPLAILRDEGVFETTPWAEFEIPKEMISFRSKKRKATLASGQGFAPKNRVTKGAL
jgi:hypothetical protein